MSWIAKYRNAISAGLLTILALAAGAILFQRYYVPPLPEPERPLAVTIGPAGGADWPQWRGPQRDGVSSATGLLADWPKDGPKLLWTFDAAGSGYSAPAVVRGKVFLPGERGAADYLLVLDADTGSLLGEAVIGHPFSNNDGDGPRATPTVDDDRVYAQGGDGDLACVEPARGAVVWRRNIFRDFGGARPFWGCAESPLVDDGRLVCTPGGGGGAVVALDKRTGAQLWRCTDLKDECGYSSLVATEGGGVHQYIVTTSESVAGIAAADGRLLWRFPRKVAGPAAPTPIVAGNLVYATAGYGTGCLLLSLTAVEGGTTAAEVYSNKVMKNHHGGVVRVGDYLYGYSDEVGWVCQELAGGKMIWSEKRKLGKGSVTAADGRLYCYSEDEGVVCLVEASPTGWKEHGRFAIPRQTAVDRKQGKIFTHPVIADGKLYLRDQELLFCFDIKAR